MKDIINDVKQGKFAIITDDAERENEADLFVAAELVTPEHINFMATNGRGLVCMPITRKRAEVLEIEPMVSRNTEKFGCKFGVSIDSKEAGSGMSAYDRALTIRKAATSHYKEDFRRPGHVFPLLAEDKGVFVRQGHTEAAVDLARICGLKPAGVICEILNEDGTMARGKDIYDFANKHHIRVLTIAGILRYRMQNEMLIEKVIDVKLPTSYGKFRLYAFKNKITRSEDLVLVNGIKDGMLVRVHSECLTGEAFSSLKCDCEEQLKTAMQIVGRSGGMIIYLRQEGRGVGLINKLRAYKLQENGNDTIQANEKLGLQVDSRDYGIAAQILKEFRVNSIKLLTNNPDKARQLNEYGIETSVIGLESMPNLNNINYIKTKEEKLGHLSHTKDKLMFI